MTHNEAENLLNEFDIYDPASYPEHRNPTIEHMLAVAGVDARLPVELTDVIRLALTHCVAALPEEWPTRQEAKAVLELIEQHTAGVVKELERRV